ncbi:hypothetical protein KIPB_013316, partial [Kipferlia bialata]|eukprot:g13316.t1
MWTASQHAKLEPLFALLNARNYKKTVSVAEGMRKKANSPMYAPATEILIYANSEMGDFHAARQALRELPKD